MSKVESGFIPLPKVEQEQPLNNIHIALNLPAVVDQDRVGVNLSRIEGLCKLSGIRRLTVVGKYGEETSHEIPTIVGMNSDGSAISSKSIARVDVPLYDSFYELTKGEKQQKSIDLKVGINLDELSLQSSQDKEGVRSPKVYTRAIDKGLRSSIRQVGKDNLIKSRVIPGYIYQDIMFPTWISLSLIDLNTHDFFGVLVASTFASLHAVARLIRCREEDGRLSFFMGTELDRAAILQAKTRTQKLVKDLHPDKK